MPVYITEEIILTILMKKILMKKILMKKILLKEILMKKILMKKIKFRMCLGFIFFMSQIIYSDI